MRVAHPDLDPFRPCAGRPRLHADDREAEEPPPIVAVTGTMLEGIVHSEVLYDEDVGIV